MTDKLTDDIDEDEVFAESGKSIQKKVLPAKRNQRHVWQGREDEDMLSEKQNGWSAAGDSRDAGDSQNT